MYIIQLVSPTPEATVLLGDTNLVVRYISTGVSTYLVYSVMFVAPAVQ
jgi:hypothetical protein